ncbi:putative Gnk2-like domain-containing protein [Helianthus annuus]|nr:putative Gnk2-like domain-containing protein [Helianthus annuus]KAJ0448408.1 putative Gnk2-like domain-containing protein [Helianthus annuus]KAJ0633296.1 putative Gnk2-like domain-containing protein [Helianthus annuus]KAJ0827385.1 putative Gnk2-like domain-containing protein [Helianthus annuus]
MANSQNSTNIDRFNGDLGPLLRKLRGDASAGGPLQKFATDNTSGPDFSTIYGRVQCTLDLSETQCSDCLEDIINRIALYFNGRVGGRILVPICNFRYEIYRFYNQIECSGYSSTTTTTTITTGFTIISASLTTRYALYLLYRI